MSTSSKAFTHMLSTTGETTNLTRVICQMLVNHLHLKIEARVWVSGILTH